MIRNTYLIFCCIILLTACSESPKENNEFVYDPTVPYPVLHPGDFWPDRFDQRGLQNVVIYQDRIYCNTIDIGGEHTYLYCFNPTNGLVEWRVPIEAYATQPVSYHKDTLIYCSYLGHIFAFDTEGNELWKNRTDRPYAGHVVDTFNSTLYIKTPYGTEISSYSMSSGALISTIESDSMKESMEHQINHLPISHKEYQFERNNTQYTLQAKEDTNGTYKIEIKTIDNSKETKAITYSDVRVVGAMKNVMWKGELDSRIYLDTLSDKKGLYGLGPESYLTGELLVNNGKSYVSHVLSDSSMAVEKRFDVSAPFFVFANVTEWNEMELPSDVKTIKDVEVFIDEKTTHSKRPFVFKLKGTLTHAQIHIQNLPKGTKVSSPDEAHQGQINYELNQEEVEIVGFFSTEHKGIFTHHDSFLHMHLITKDESKMGHLDEMEIGKMMLYLPKK